MSIYFQSEGSSRSNTPLSDHYTTNISTDTTSEDSSLDSSNEDDLFTHHKQELYHFAPSITSLGINSNAMSPHHFIAPSVPPPNDVLLPKERLPSKPHLLRRKSMTTSTSVQKKSTPPSGSTHVPRPHPQVSQPVQNRVAVKPVQNRRSRARPQHEDKKLKKSNNHIDLSALSILFGK